MRVDNPFVGATWYVNQDWSEKARTYGGAGIAGYNTAVWMDRIGAIAPTDPNVLGLREHLEAALDQGANLILVVIYDLPNRDCFALASNGELKIKENGFNRYKNEYVTPIVEILSDSKYKSLRIVTIIEPDSLPNLVTNLTDPDCQEASGKGGYVEATQFTLNSLYPISNVYSYIDIAHSGWLGWPENFDKGTKLIADAIKGTTNGVKSVAGFISNTANSTSLTEPFLDEFSLLPVPGSTSSQVRAAKFYEYNPYFSELPFVQAWRLKMISLGFPASIGMLVDTSRNGWGGADRPTAVSTSTDVDKFVDESRVDRRTHRGMWCNQASGIGERPQATPAPGVDAYVWVKPPGESDGVGMAGIIDPTDPAKGFDRFCDPTFVVPANMKITGAMAGAPHAGRWFTEGFKALLKNAYPPIDGVDGGTPSSKSSASSMSKASSSSGTVTGKNKLVSGNGQLSVKNGKLVNAAGQDFQLRGMSSLGLNTPDTAPWVNINSLRWLRDDWNSNVIRAAMYTEENDYGYIVNPGVANKVWEVVDAAIALDMYVLVDWHILADNDPNKYVEQAKTFFAEVARRYGNKPNIIYEIANEPNGANVQWNNAIKPYAEKVIPVIRAIDPDGIVIVGTANWSQYVDDAADNPLSYSNVMYALHFYSCTHKEELRARARKAIEKGAALFSTEWGTSAADGNGGNCVEEAGTWLDFFDQNNISWANWSLTVRNESSAALKSSASQTGNWTDGDLTTSGKWVRNRLKSYPSVK